MKRIAAIVLLSCASFTLWGQDASSYLRLADSQTKAGQYRQALATVQKAIAADPRNPQAYDKLGEVYGKLNMPSESATAYEKSADLLTGAPAPQQPMQQPRAQAPPAARAAAPAMRAPTPAPAAEQPAPAARGGGGGGGGGGLDGLYLMTRFWMGSGLELATYRFHDGTVILNPIGSTRTLDLAAERASHPNGVGTYRMQGGQLVITFPDGNHQAKFEPEKGGCFGWDSGSFCPVEVFKPGSTLDGTFEGGASVGGGAVMSSTTITFHRDGSYQRDGVASVASRGTLTSVSGGATSSERGRYRIDGTALTLMPDGGQQTVVSTFPWDDGSTGPTPHSVYFGGGMLKRIR